MTTVAVMGCLIVIVLVIEYDQEIQPNHVWFDLVQPKNNLMISIAVHSPLLILEITGQLHTIFLAQYVG